MFDIFKKIESERRIKNSAPIEYIIAGLGNPGIRYEKTRHNAGFIAIDCLKDQCNITVVRNKFKSLVGECTIAEKRCLVMKPQTFMNNSGEALQEAMSFYKIPPENTIIIFDDISLPVGKMRIRRKGSHGGHNGIKSIINLSGSDTFPRIKLGVGAKPIGWDLVDWVLSKFSNEELETLNSTVKNVLPALNDILTGNIDKAMNKYN